MTRLTLELLYELEMKRRREAEKVEELKPIKVNHALCCQIFNAWRREAVIFCVFDQTITDMECIRPK